MKLNEFVSKYYRCSFPESFNLSAIEYYRKHSDGTQCLFIFDNMIANKDFSLCDDDIKFMNEPFVAFNVFPELFEAFLYAAYEDFKKTHIKPKNLVIVIPDEENHLN